MQTFRGKGKIYDSKGSLLSTIVYDIYILNSTSGSKPKWRGEITPDNGIMPVGDHVIELADGRCGPCVISTSTYSSFGLVIDSFGVEGTGPLTK